MEVSLTKEYITGLIEKIGMSKADFAAKMGIKRQNLDAMLEANKKDINVVLKMAEVLGMRLEEFIGIEKEEVYGCLYINGKPNIVNSKEEALKLLNSISVQ